MKLERYHDWPERYIAFIEARRGMPFSWGVNDCALFWADMIIELTGTDVAEPWRGYTTERGALAHIRKAGGLRELVLAAGLTEKHTGLAGRTDVVIADCEGRETYGVIDHGQWCGPGPERMEFRPLSDVLAAFEF